MDIVVEESQLSEPVQFWRGLVPSEIVVAVPGAVVGTQRLIGLLGLSDRRADDRGASAVGDSAVQGLQQYGQPPVRDGRIVGVTDAVDLHVEVALLFTDQRF
ncbi:hypothetical protein ACFYU9_25665 [Streptomyces sp. NPDC004327]|uniref:hypothetical protein n=1 Tax=Streptomyces sp. NPDC004327 TaxID=3364699 RepID=UPI0036C935F2